MESNRKLRWFLSIIIPALSLPVLFGQSTTRHKPSPESYQGKTVGISVNSKDGTYTLFDPVSQKPILTYRVAAEVDHHWLRSTDYPQHTSTHQSVSDELGSGTLLISNTGLRSQPDLIYSLRIHSDPEFVTTPSR